MTDTKIKLLLLVIGGYLMPNMLFAAEPVDADKLHREQQERVEQNQQQRESRPDIRVNIQTGGNTAIPLEESPCFPLKSIKLETYKTDDTKEKALDFSWAKDAAFRLENGRPGKLIGRCIGAKGIEQTIRRIQNFIIKLGFVTTRVLAKKQDFRSGHLKLVVVPGKVQNIQFHKGVKGKTNLRNALPIESGELLNLRDIEQGLENFKRVPTADAEIKIKPSKNKNAKPGDSDLIIMWEQERKWRLAASLDNSGSDATGEWQASTTLSLDNPLLMNDLFYLTLTNNIGNSAKGEHGTGGHILHYSVPADHWTIGATHSKSNYDQTVIGATLDYIYSGKSENNEINLTRVIHRDSTKKIKLNLTGWTRESQNFINDTEIEVQHRKTAGWEVRLGFSKAANGTKKQIAVTYRHGTGAFGALEAPEDAFGEGASKARILKINASLEASLPLKIQSKKIKYQGSLRAQLNRTPLVPQDRISLGSRHSVRGFDEKASLSGDKGWIVRNTFSLPIANTNSQAYLGLDVGHVSGKSTKNLVGKTLAGAALGIKGKKNRFSYDMTIGAPLHHPDAFRTDDANFTAQIHWSY